MTFTHTGENSDVILLPVQNQGNCDSCVYISCAELLGVLRVLKKKKIAARRKEKEAAKGKKLSTEQEVEIRHIPLSAQDALDNVPIHFEYKDKTLPPYPEHVAIYLEETGIVKACHYPYLAKRSVELPPGVDLRTKYKLTGFFWPYNNPDFEDDVLACIWEYPVIGVLKYTQKLYDLKRRKIYKSNKYKQDEAAECCWYCYEPIDKCECLDHAMLIVGYRTVGRTPVYVCKNSWGRSWSSGGYGWVERSEMDYFIIFNGVKFENAKKRRKRESEISEKENAPEDHNDYAPEDHNDNLNQHLSGSHSKHQGHHGPRFPSQLPTGADLPSCTGEFLYSETSKTGETCLALSESVLLGTEEKGTKLELVSQDLQTFKMSPNNNWKYARAYKAMKALGYSKETVKPILGKLLAACEKNWYPIEDNNYAVLVDAILADEDQMKKDKELTSWLEDESEENERPLKRCRRTSGSSHSLPAMVPVFEPFSDDHPGEFLYSETSNAEETCLALSEPVLLGTEEKGGRSKP